MKVRTERPVSRLGAAAALAFSDRPGADPRPIGRRSGDQSDAAPNPFRSHPGANPGSIQGQRSDEIRGTAYEFTLIVSNANIS